VCAAQFVCGRGLLCICSVRDLGERQCGAGRVCCCVELLWGKQHAGGALVVPRTRPLSNLVVMRSYCPTSGWGFDDGTTALLALKWACKPLLPRRGLWGCLLLGFQGQGEA
jgi:hypothetical protein